MKAHRETAVYNTTKIKLSNLYLEKKRKKRIVLDSTYSTIDLPI